MTLLFLFDNFFLINSVTNVENAFLFKWNSIVSIIIISTFFVDTKSNIF